MIKSNLINITYGKYEEEEKGNKKQEQNHIQKGSILYPII